MKAAHTEVKATLSNMHAAQALYMVDNNEYAADFTTLKVPKPGGTYDYSDAASSGTADTFKLEKQVSGTPTLDKSVFQLYASASKKLAGCSNAATSAPFDVWCLDHTKHMSNTSLGNNSTCTGTLVDGGAGC